MKKCSSVVWQFFDRLVENNRCVAVLCKLCDCEYKYFGNTTNLRAHLVKKHPLQWDLRKTNEDGYSAVEIVPKQKNVRSSLSDRKITEEDAMPQIEIERVDIIEKQENDDDEEEVHTTNHLIQHMHNQVSDEEWLEDDYQQVNMYERKRKPIKRENMTPPRKRLSSYVVRNPSKADQLNHIVLDNSSIRDEYSVFGEYIANKLRKFKQPRTRGNIQQLITTILWDAENGMYDNTDVVKQVLMRPIPSPPTMSETNNEQNVDNHMEVNLHAKSKENQVDE